MNGTGDGRWRGDCFILSLEFDMLPAGIADGVLSGLAAVLILVGYLGRKKIIS